MAQTHTGELPLQMPPATVEHRANIRTRLHSCFFSGLASVVSSICIGLVSGAPGGLLLGATAVVVLQSLEVLAEKRPLMDTLENYISLRDCVDHVCDTHISIFVVEFGVISSTLSTVVGVFLGLSTYNKVIEKHGEAAMGKALGLAGSVCLMGVTATGCVVGPTLEGILWVSSTIDIVLPWVLISFSVFFINYCMCGTCFDSYDSPFVCWLSTPLAVAITFLITLLSKSRLVLMVTLIPTLLAGKLFGEMYDFQLTIVSVPLMLIITDVFAIARKPIIFLQPQASTNTNCVVLEGIFIGVLTSQLVMAAIGMSLCVSWQRGGAGKICVSAAGSGTAVLGAIKLALPVLGPGPSIGALMGVAGAVGVSLSAAGAAADRYGWVGELGVTLGAAVGAFLASCAHSGLSGVFMGLCAAVIPGGPYLKLFLWFLERLPKWYGFCLCICLCIVVPIILFIWLYFTYTYVSLASLAHSMYTAVVLAGLH